MDLDSLLLILAVVSALVLLGRVLRSKPRPWDWFVVAVLVLAIAAGAWWTIPEQAGLVSFGLWALLGWGPLLAGRAAKAAVDRLAFGPATAFAVLAVVLHPARPQRAMLPRLRAMRLADKGQYEEAAAIYDALAARGRARRVHPAEVFDDELQALRLRGRYDLLDLASEGADPVIVRASPALYTTLLRVDLDLGRRDRMAKRHWDVGRFFAAPSLAGHIELVRLMLLASAGRARAVQALLATSFSGLAPSLRELWSSTAQLASGDRSAQLRLEALGRSASGVVRLPALARARHADVLLSSELTAAGAALLDDLERQIQEERRFLVGGSGARTPITVALAVVLLGVFAVEVALGGSTNLDVLMRMGALYAPDVLHAHQVWRIVAFLFLHYGAAHLAFNTLGLLVLAPFVERTLGPARFLATYFGSGLAGAFVILARAAFSRAEPEPTVGASGSIMGLVGASCAILLVGWVRERALIARRRFLVLLGLVVVQSIVDLLIPQVSMVAHLSGVFAGFLVALPLVPRTRTPRLA
ncbi:MAG: rhomboid family intramembrane serine protease [Polyangiaceae bacterium]